MTQSKSMKLVDVNKAAKEADNKDDAISRSELETLKSKALASEALELRLQELEKQASEKDTALADLAKAKEKADKQLEDIEKAKVAAKLADTVEVLKGFNLVDEENITDVAKFLVKNDGETATSVILTTLEKARTAIKAFGEKEHGSDLDAKEVDVDKSLSGAVSKIIKSRKSEK